MSKKAHLVDLAGELERHLGDPHDPASRMSFKDVLEFDEREEYPYPLLNMLQRRHLPEYALPGSHGGMATDVEVGFNLMRMVARRDPTSAAALMLTSLAFMPTWIAGTDEQKRHLISAIKNGGVYAWGLSERDHGSDLLNNGMRAVKVDGGYLLGGEKWLIGNATVADGLAIFARTDPKGGPAGYSIFMLEKRKAPAGTVDELPNERLHGLRAIDMSGVRLDGVFVPDSALVGREGQGLELALKTAQTARTVIGCLALSAADTSMRVVMDFAENRIIFGKAVADIPYSRRQLVECFADLFIGDAVALGAVRALQVAPQQTSVWSSVSKYFLPTLFEGTVSQLNVVIGARFYLRAHPHYGIQQKMGRDLVVANFADGNTVVNLKNIALQLDQLVATMGDAGEELRAESIERVGVLYDMDAEMPPYQPWRQELFSRGKDDALLAFPDSLAKLRVLAADAKPQERDWLLRAADAAETLVGQAPRLREECAALREQFGKEYAQSAELFDLAKQYSLMHAAAACVHTHVYSHGLMEDPLPSGALLLLQMERLHRHFRPHEAITDVAVIDEVMRILRHMYRENRLFSYWQFQLADRGDVASAHN